MFRHKMDLMLKIFTIPFTEYEFYKTDYIERLAKIKDIEAFKKYFNETFVCHIYSIINKRQRIYNLDEINLLFEKFYPKSKLNKVNSITKYYMNSLSKLSKSFICHRDGRIALKYWESDCEEDIIGPYKGINKIALWNSLNRMFTTELLVIRYLIDNNMASEEYLTGYYSSIMLEDLQLQQILRQGVAETHIHKGAGINFYISWQDIMTLTGKSMKSFKENFFTDYVLGSSCRLEYYVQAMAIIRVIMASFLVNRRNCSHSEFNFQSYLQLQFNDGGSYNTVRNRTKGSIRDDSLLDLIDHVFEGKDITQNCYKYFDLWDRLKEKGFIPKKSDIVKSPIEEDVLKGILNSVSYVKTAPENIFLLMCMKYIDCNDDYYFSKIFWQYIRIKNEVFQLKVQGNLIRGLLNFKNYFERSKKVSYTGKQYWKLIMLNQFQNKNLKKLELRTGFGGRGSVKEIKGNIKKTVISFLEAYLDLLENMLHNEQEKYLEVPRVGLVFHFIKMQDNKAYEKCWQNYTNMNLNELSYKELQDIYLRQIEALNELREEIPGISEYLIGIDAASIENNTDPWVFAPVYEKARDSTQKNLYINKHTRIKTLGFTFHVGEEFRHLLTGLRRIDEAIEHFKFHAGDRIGHGIALGINVDKWIVENKIVILPRGEYIENLLWIWGLYKDGKYNKGLDITYLEQEIMKQAQKVYLKMEGITTYALWKAYRNKFSAFSLFQGFVKSNNRVANDLFCTFVNSKDTIIWNEEKLSYVQHCRCYLERILEPIQIELNEQDVEMIKSVQKIISLKISRVGIVVETNPSSNVAIGDIENIFEHYVHNLNQRGLNTGISPEHSVMISINSDDPSVFNTNVSNEFAYIFYSLQEKGYSREDALLWIDKIRKYGMDSSFIDERCNMGNKEIITEIKSILDRLEN